MNMIIFIAFNTPPEYYVPNTMHLPAYCVYDVRIMTKLFILFMNTNIIVIEISLSLTDFVVVYDVYHVS